MSFKPLPWSKTATRARIAQRPLRLELGRYDRSALIAYSAACKSRACYVTVAGAAEPPPENVLGQHPPAPLGQLAKQKEEDKQFFADLLVSAATRRDAKAYLTRLKTPPRTANAPIDSHRPRSKTSNLFGRSAAVDTSPVFQQHNTPTKQPIKESEIPHVALVKISGLEQIHEGVLRGITGTLAQLARLSMLPCVVVDEPHIYEPHGRKAGVSGQTDRLVSLLDETTEQGGRKITDILTIGPDGRARLSMPDLLYRPLHRGRIPVVVPVAYDESTQRATNITANETMLALTQYMSSANRDGPDAVSDEAETQDDHPNRVLLDRIIVIDPSGGIPSPKSDDQMHVFVNMAQEYHALQEELRSSTDLRVSPQHASNLAMLRRALNMLPQAASGLITTPEEAANSSQRRNTDIPVSSVGTRRQRNPLIHNLLTDKPAYSSSLPSTRLSATSPSVTSSTFVKHGMPLTIFPNPAAQAWAPTKKPWIKLTDPRIDLDRLVHLINDSFDRTLDVEAYLRRVNDSIAGVIIAGDYEGGAILTWERPPYLPPDTDRLVPYLDKFAVLKKAQGAGGVADILFNAMVRTCFPNGVCWRSRKDNPVNKWYFERSRGTWKIPDMNWTMFWTTPGMLAERDDQTFLDYEAVCRGVQPTWMDGKKVED